jgi:hypothetical protein
MPIIGPRPKSPQERAWQEEVDSLQGLVNELVAEGDPTGGGMKSYLDSVQESLRREQQVNQALWDTLGLSPDQATDYDWRRLADQLTEQGRELYTKYTKEGIRSFVARAKRI